VTLGSLNACTECALKRWTKRRASLSAPPANPIQPSQVIDLFRNGGKDNEEASNPMARFSDNWENEYVADYMKEDRAAAKGDPNGQFAGRGPDRKASSGRNVPNADQTGLNNLAPWDRIW